MAALNAPAPLDLRVNALKADRDTARRALAAEHIHAEPTPWSPLGLRLKHRAPLAGDRRVQGRARRGAGRGLAARRPARRRAPRHAGRRFLRRRRRQDAGARRPDAKPRQARRLRCRCMAAGARRQRGCAAPASAMSSAAPLSSRARPLGQASRQRASTACLSMRRVSGSAAGGATRTANGARRPQDLAELVPRQRDILASAARLVKPGGRLVYATCSLLREENEAQAEAFLARRASRRHRLVLTPNPASPANCSRVRSDTE